MKGPFCFQIFLVGCLTITASGQLPEVASLASTGPEPGWITLVAIPEAENFGAYEDAGTKYLLVSDQLRPKEETLYGKRAFRYLTVGGVEDNSTLTWYLDPDYETFVLHSLQIHRNGKILDRRDEVEFRLSSSYQDDDARSYDNAVELRIILEDARIGDILEYSYSISGRSPVVGERFASNLSLNWSIPVERIYQRILWEKERPLRLEVYGPEPQIEETESATEYIWSREAVEPYRWDDSMPPYLYVQDWVQLSDWASWQEVSEWGADLYPMDAPLPETLEPVIAAIRAEESLDERILAAIRFVQDEYRYVSVVFGPHNYQPFSLDEIARRRYGDCKDKALLLCRLLKEIAVRAEPVLVDVEDRGTVTDMPPSPRVFDHVVVRFYHHGKFRYVDPTLTEQGGGLDQYFFPAYQAGLPLTQPGSDIAKGVGPQAEETSSTVLIESFAITGWNKPADFDVETTYRGADADSMRRYLNSLSLVRLERDYQEYYNDEYGAISIRQPIEVSDDRNTNTITVKEFYTIEDLFKPDEGDPDGQEYQYFESTFISNRLPQATKGAERIHPFYVYHDNVRQILKITIPDASQFESEAETINNKRLRFDYRVEQTGNLLTLDNHLQINRGEISVSEYDAFAADIARISFLLSYGITTGVGDEEEPTVARTDAFYLNWSLVTIIALVCSVSAAAGIWLLLRPAPRNPLPPALSGPEGLGGWLILPLLGSILRPVGPLVALVDSHYLLDATQWSNLVSPVSENFIPYLEPLLLFSFGFNACMLVASVIVLIAFFQKRWFLPRLIQGVLLVGAIGITADGFGSLILFETSFASEEGLESIGTVLRAWIACAIWIPYFAVSKRVKNTFRR